MGGREGNARGESFTNSLHFFQEFEKYSLKRFTKSFLSHRVGEIDEDTKSLGACSIDTNRFTK